MTPRVANATLQRLGPGQSAIIVSVARDDRELVKYLAALGLVPHAKVDVEEIAPFGGPMLVRVGSSRYAIGRDVAARIAVRTLA